MTLTLRTISEWRALRSQIFRPRANDRWSLLPNPSLLATQRSFVSSKKKKARKEAADTTDAGKQAVQEKTTTVDVEKDEARETAINKNDSSYETKRQVADVAKPMGRVDIAKIDVHTSMKTRGWTSGLRRWLVDMVSALNSFARGARPEDADAMQPDRFDFSCFRENDLAFVRFSSRNGSGRFSGRSILMGPLRPGGTKGTYRGSVSHDSIIGQPAGSVSTTRTGISISAHFPTLDEYCLAVSRVATPIYPKDAATIVSLLDLRPKSRVLEAGTGNGALTLCLARTVYPDGLVHTIDRIGKHQKRAKRNVDEFARGMYSNIVQYSIGACGKLLSGLDADHLLYDAAVLDMPDSWLALSAVTQRLKDDRFVVCFLPNMSQVLDCLRHVRNDRLPLTAEQILEVTWRQWDVRETVIKTRTTMEFEENSPFESYVLSEDREESDEAFETDFAEEAKTSDGIGNRQRISDGETIQGLKSAWVCRPAHLAAGHTGFLVQFRKSANTEDE